MIMTTRHTRITTALGELTLVADGDALIGLYFPHHWYLPAAGTMGDLVHDDPFFAEVAAQLDDYLAGRRTSFDLPVALSGDDFQQSVWTMLTEIPYGQTTTYGDLAARLGDPALAQAVGQAVGHNPVSIIVPCHRVVGKDGKLTGYAGGLRRKQHLLDLEEPALAKAGRLF
jgi:methylated-DNA-[protein]-cysteine S-methyltransferase